MNPPDTCCVASGKMFHFSEPWRPRLHNKHARLQGLCVTGSESFDAPITCNFKGLSSPNATCVSAFLLLHSGISLCPDSLGVCRQGNVSGCRGVSAGSGAGESGHVSPSP